MHPTTAPIRIRILHSLHSDPLCSCVEALEAPAQNHSVTGTLFDGARVHTFKIKETTVDREQRTEGQNKSKAVFIRILQLIAGHRARHCTADIRHRTFGHRTAQHRYITQTFTHSLTRSLIHILTSQIERADRQTETDGQTDEANALRVFTSSQHMHRQAIETVEQQNRLNWQKVK